MNCRNWVNVLFIAGGSTSEKSHALLSCTQILQKVEGCFHKHQETYGHVVFCVIEGWQLNNCMCA